MRIIPLLVLLPVICRAQLKGKAKQLAKKKLAKERAQHLSNGTNTTLDHAMIIESDLPLGSLWYPPPSTTKEWRELFKAESRKDGVKNALPSPETQCVYLDFNQRAPYSVSIENIDGEQVGTFGPFNGYHYTEFEKQEILSRLRRDFHLYNYYFTDKKPDHGEYTTIRFNANDFPDIEYAITTQITDDPSPGTLRVKSTLFGFAAGGIDYLNLIRDDLVRVNGNLWSFLVEIDPDGDLFELYSGIPLPVGPTRRWELLLALSRATINQSSNTAAHELGHALGLRHHDSHGAPGDGLPDSGLPSTNAYYAPYPGPQLATESFLHLMASSAALGILTLNYSDHAQKDRFFSERSSVKLTFAEGCGHFLPEEKAKKYGDEIDGMEIPEFYVQNPIEEGENKGGRYLRIDAVNIAGCIKHPNEVDSYRLYLKKDRIFTAEVISWSSTLKDRVMTTLTLLRVYNDGRREIVASNDIGFEGFDPHIFDVVVPATGTYVLAVGVQLTIPIDRESDGVFDDLYSVKRLGGGDFLTGEYNLLIYNHHDPIQKHRYRDDFNLCMNTKKVPHRHSDSSKKHSSSGYSHGSDDDYTHGSDDDYTHGSDDDYTHGSDDDYTHGSDDDYTHGSDDDYTHGSDHSLRGSSVSSTKGQGGNDAKQWQPHGGT